MLMYNASNIKELKLLNKEASHKISVIIPTLNAEKYIPPLIDSLKKQTIPPDEIIIIHRFRIR